MEFQRMRGVATSVRFPMKIASSANFATSSDWTPAAADAGISQSGGNVAQCTNTITAVGGATSVLWELSLTATEMNADEITIQIVDAATKAVEDQCLIISTRMGGQVAANQGITMGEVDTSTFTATTSALEGTRIGPIQTEETTADHYNGAIILFTSGDVRGIRANVTDYVLANSKEKFSYDTIVTAPVSGDTYVIL